MTRLVYGCELDSWESGYAVHEDVVFEGNSGSGWTTIPADEYLVHPRMGALTRTPYDDAGDPVDWSAYQAYQDAGNNAFRATYTLFNLSTLAGTTKTQEVQRVETLDWGITPFDVDTGRLNETTPASGKFLMGDFLSLGEVGTRPTDSTHGTGIWGDANGLVGLNAGVVQAIFSAVDGTITAGANAVILDTEGITLTGGTGDTNQVKWLDGTFIAGLYGVKVSGNSFLVLNDYGTANDKYANVTIYAHSTDAGSAGFEMYAFGSTYPSVGGTSYAVLRGVSSAFTGLGVSSAGAMAPTALLHLNQGAGDTAILRMESSDVAHGMTDLAPTAIYGEFLKAQAAVGGLEVNGYTESTFGLVARGRVAATNATRGTTARAPVEIHAELKTSATVGSMGANTNMMCVADNGTVRFILDSDGDSHQDVGTAWTNYSVHNDVELLTALSVDLSKEGDPIRDKFGGFLTKHRAELEALKIVTFNDNTDGHAFINWSKTMMLMIGAIIQANTRIDHLEQGRGGYALH